MKKHKTMTERGPCVLLSRTKGGACNEMTVHSMQRVRSSFSPAEPFSAPAFARPTELRQWASAGSEATEKPDAFSSCHTGKKLSNFGIKLGKSTANGSIDKDSFIKCVLTRPPDREIVFRFEPKDPCNRIGAWSEKKMADAVKLPESWAVDLGINSTMLRWCHKDQEMKNGKGCNTRLFSIPVSEAPSGAQIKQLLTFISDNVNSMQHNNTTCTLDGENIFWIEGEVAWSDIIGRRAAFSRLTSRTGRVMDDTYYERYKDLIHCYFPEQSFTEDECRLLGAPIEQLKEDVRQAVALSQGRCDLLRTSAPNSDDAEMTLRTASTLRTRSNATQGSGCITVETVGIHAVEESDEEYEFVG